MTEEQANTIIEQLQELNRRLNEVKGTIEDVHQITNQIQQTVEVMD